MRLWAREILPYLPKSQLVAQNRELGSIFKKQDNHILINFIYEYDKKELLDYTICIWKEMIKRNYCIRSFDNFNIYFDDLLPYEIHKDNYIGFSIRYVVKDSLFKDKFTDRYLLQNFFNLQEKFDVQQKDYPIELYKKLENHMKKRGLIRGN